GRFLSWAVMSIGVVVGASAPVHAAQSSKVAYVNDIGSGSNDPTFPHGSSIFVNALTGVAVPNGGTYTTGGGLTVTVTNVSVATLDALGVAALNGFDTVIMYQICDIGSHPLTMAAINAYLTAGSGKVMIFDADHCFDSAPSPADYTAFLFPFTSST